MPLSVELADSGRNPCHITVCPAGVIFGPDKWPTFAEAWEAIYLCMEGGHLMIVDRNSSVESTAWV